MAKKNNPETSFIQYKTDDGIELVIDNRTGEAFATQAGYARMSGKDRTTIVRRCEKLCELDGYKMAETDTGYGFKLSALIPANIISKWIIKDNPELAEMMLQVGVTVYMHQLAGYKITSTAVEPPTPQNISRKYLLGTWKEQREQGKAARKRFDQVVAAYETPHHSKYTNKIYQALFGTTAEKLRSLPVVAGNKSIGRNHIPEVVEIYAVEAVEALVVDYFEQAEKLGFALSMTRAIALASHQVKMALDVPTLGSATPKATVLFEMMSKNDNTKSINTKSSNCQDFDKDFLDDCEDF